MRVALVNPPFANLYRASIALAQLRASVQATLPGVEVDIHNLSLDCVPVFGVDWYTEISDGTQSWTGLGDWLFRSLAFPDLPDNTEQYLDWLATETPDQSGPDFRESIREFRRLLGEAFPRFIAERELASYDVVGSSSMFAQSLSSLAVLRLVKEQNPAAVTVMGGANCDSPMGEGLVEKFRFVDRVFSGRAVRSLPIFLDAYRRTKSLDAIPPIAGVLQRGNQQGGGDGVHAPPASSLPNLPPNLPGLSLSLEYDDYRAELQAAPFEAELVLPYETSSGCWWGEESHCPFCALNAMFMEYKLVDADSAVEMINSLVAKYSDVCKSYEAVDNILSHDYFTSVIPRLRVPEDVTLFYQTKANLSEDQVKALARARIRKIQPGIEALSTPELKLLRKGSTAFQNVALLRHCRTHGISPDWNILAGIPGESGAIYDLYRRELPKLFHLQPPAGAFVIRFDRFSPYFDNAEEYSLSLAPFPFYAFLYPFGEPWLSQVAYFFLNTNESSDYVPALDRELEGLRGIVKEWRTRWQSEPRPRLELTYRAGVPTILDSRASEPPVELAIDESLVLALGYLDQPRTREELHRFLRERGVGDRAAQETMEIAFEKGLLFEEQSRVMSVVVDPERARSEP